MVNEDEATEVKADMVLEDWYIGVLGAGEFYIRGIIFNDTQGRWEDGTPIRTSRIKSFYPNVSKPVAVKTLNNLYALGTPSPFFVPLSEDEFLGNGQ